MMLTKLQLTYKVGIDESSAGGSVNSGRRHATIGIILLLIISFLLWAALSDIDQHVRANGRVVPAGNARTVQHLEGGIVMEILVEEGDDVRAGETLFQIANTQVKTTLQEGQLQQGSLRIRRERLLAEVRDVDDLRFPSDLELEHADFVEAERELFQLRRKQYKERRNGLRLRHDQKRLEREALNSRVANMDDELSNLQRQVDIKGDLYQSGILSETDFLQIKSELIRLQSERKNTQMQIPIVTAELNEASSEIEEVQRNYASEAKSELNEVEVSLSSFKERLSALSDEVNRSEIVSPIDGRVNRIYVNTVGGVSQPGAPLAEITPARETLVVEGTMSTEDRGKVWPELRTITHISAYDHSLYGGLDGTLSYISPDTFSNADAGEYYKIRVALDSDRFDKERLVRPGMTAEINILTGKVSVLGAILKPLTRLRSTALRES